MRNNRSEHARKFPAVSASYPDVVCGALREHYGPRRHAAEMLARDAGATPRAARNWLSGTNAPNGEPLLRLMAACRPLANAIYEAVEAHKEKLRADIRRLDREWEDGR